MIITENDIFTYVYFRNDLPEDKLKFIEANLDSYREIISYYESNKKVISDLLPPSAESAIETVLNSISRVELYPLQTTGKKDNITRYAAGSLNETPSVKAISFTDKEAKHIIRALFFSDKTELYVLTSGDKKLENFTLITKPSLKQYYFSDNQHPVTTAEKIIDQIDILYH